MSNDKRLRSQKPFDIRERLFVFACDVVAVAQKLHTRGPIAGSFCPTRKRRGFRRIERGRSRRWLE
jgi:hypothetical protein